MPSSTGAKRWASRPGTCSTKSRAPTAASSTACSRSAAATRPPPPTPTTANRDSRRWCVSSGPFRSRPARNARTACELPQYVGAVRVMVVAGDGSAYGSADKSVFVRQALMILPTLPRVIGPDEQFSLPVSVFTSEASIKSVKLEVQTDARFSAVGNAAHADRLHASRGEARLPHAALGHRRWAKARSTWSPPAANIRAE